QLFAAGLTDDLLITLSRLTGSIAVHESGFGTPVGPEHHRLRGRGRLLSDRITTASKAWYDSCRTGCASPHGLFVAKIRPTSGPSGWNSGWTRRSISPRRSRGKLSPPCRSPCPKARRHGYGAAG